MKKQILALALSGTLLAGGVAGCTAGKDAASTASGAASEAVSKISSAVSKVMEGAEIALRDIRNAVKDAYGEGYIPNMEYTKEEIEQNFGLKEDLYDEVIAEGPMISANADTFIGVKAKKGKADEVEKALNKYRDTLIKDTMQYPTNAVKIQASRVVRQGDYVFFLLLGNIPMDVESQGEEAILKAAQEQNKIAEDAINKLFNK